MIKELIGQYISVINTTSPFSIRNGYKPAKRFYKIVSHNPDNGYYTATIMNPDDNWSDEFKLYQNLANIIYKRSHYNSFGGVEYRLLSEDEYLLASIK